MKITKRKIHSDDILCMSAARGAMMVNPSKKPFSFYFSGKNSSHGIRVKPTFNSSKIILNRVGTLKLCDDWKYIPGEDDKHVKAKDVEEMKQFFRDYFVLFSLVWDFKLSDPTLADYFEGRIELSDLIESILFYNDYKEGLDEIDSVEQLEEFLVANDLVNMYGN